MRSDAVTPIGYGLPQISSTQPLERIVLTPAVKTSEFWGLQGASALPWLADLFSSAPLPLWIKLTISAACQIALALARAWPKSRVAAVLDKLPLGSVVAITGRPMPGTTTGTPPFVEPPR